MWAMSQGIPFHMDLKTLKVHCLCQVSLYIHFFLTANHQRNVKLWDVQPENILSNVMQSRKSHILDYPADPPIPSIFHPTQPNSTQPRPPKKKYFKRKGKKGLWKSSKWKTIILQTSLNLVTLVVYGYVRACCSWTVIQCTGCPAALAGSLPLVGKQGQNSTRITLPFGKNQRSFSCKKEKQWYHPSRCNKQ